MTVKQLFLYVLKKIPSGSRFRAASVAFKADFRLLSVIYSASADNKIFSDKEIENIFADLDEKSIAAAKLFMKRQLKVPAGSVFIHPEYFFSEAEQQEYKKLLPIFKKECRKYGFNLNDVGPESIYYHHGLRFAPEFVKKNIAGKLFADVGGFLGDSALVFQNYSPKKIIIFEPFEKYRNKISATLKKNSLNDSEYEIIPFALSDCSTNIDEMACRTLDELFCSSKDAFGVLKADIEGMGLNFVHGAEQIIRRDRPLLSLSIYHNANEFTGIYQTLKSWDLNYHIEIKSFSPLTNWGEYSLFAYPKEWIS